VTRVSTEKRSVFRGALVGKKSAMESSPPTEKEAILGCIGGVIRTKFEEALLGESDIELPSEGKRRNRKKENPKAVSSETVNRVC